MNVQSNGHYGLRLFIMFIFYLQMQNFLPKQEKKQQQQNNKTAHRQLQS